ncbi:MAG: energy transducer TonB [Bacteroidota bacterium]
MKVFVTFSFSLFFLGFSYSILKAQNSPISEFNTYSFQTQEPVPLNYTEICQSISYPSEAVNSRIEGLVQVLVQVDRQGRYMRHQVVGNSHPVLAKAVGPKLNCLSFIPAFENGKAVEGWRAIPFRFRILEKVSPRANAKIPPFICPEPQESDTTPIVNVN